MSNAPLVSLLVLACSAIALGANCPDPGFAARSERFSSGRDDQTSTASHEPTDTVTYLCDYGSDDVMQRTTILKCQSSGQWTKTKPNCPLDAWGRCRQAGCDCNQASKTVSCRTTSFPNRKEFFPKDTLTLSLHKTSEGLKPSDFPGGMFDNLKELKELHVSSVVDAEIKAKGWSQFMSIGYFLPITKLEKFTLAGERNPLVGFSYSYDKETKACEKAACYSECGEPTLLNPKYGIRNTDSQRTLYGLRFNLDQLDNVPGRTTVHAQTTYFTKILNIPAGAQWTIITREYFTNYDVRSGPIRFGGQDPACSVQMVTPSKPGEEKLMLLKHGPLTIYAERITYWSHYYAGKRGCQYLPGQPSSVPAPSVDLAQAATICAINMADPDPDVSTQKEEERSEISLMTFEYVAKVLSVPQSRGLAGADEVLSYVRQSRERLVATKRKYARYVPFLSKKTYEDLLAELHRSGDTYRTHFYTFEGRIDRVSDGIASTKLMVQKSKDMITAARVTFNNAVEVLTTSELTLNKIEKKFQEADDALAVKRKNFEDGIIAYGVTSGVKSFLSIVKGIGSIVKGGFLVKGENNAGAGDIMIGLATIGETIMNVVSLVQKVQKTMKSNRNLMQAAKSMDSSADREVSEYVDDLDAAAELRVQLVFWDNLVSEVDEMLGKGDVATIQGCAQYRLGLSTLGAYGKAVTEETIRQTALIRDSLEKKALMKNMERENERLTKSTQNAEQEKRLTEDLYASVYFQAADVKMTISRTLRQYCLSFFYYQLQECSPHVRPKLSDSLFTLLQKINSAKQEAITSLGSTKGAPQPFDDLVVALTDQSGTCTSIAMCPVANFRATRELVFTIPLNEPAFIFTQRVRLEEVSVELIGVRAPSGATVFLLIETSGDFKDNYRADFYNFTSAPLTKGFSYYPSTNKVFFRANVHDSHSKYFIETSPFTTWRVTLPTSLSGGTMPTNQGVDISGVTSVKVHFRGYGIARSIFRRNLGDMRRRSLH